MKTVLVSVAVIGALIFGAPAAQADSVLVRSGEVHVIGCFAPYESVGFYRFGVRVDNQISEWHSDQPFGVQWSAGWVPQEGGTLSADAVITQSGSRRTEVVNQSTTTFGFRYTCSP